MNIKYCIFDVGQVCYSFSLIPLNNFCRNLCTKKELFDKIGGVKSFNYNPFMKGDICFSDFCKELCVHCGIEYKNNLDILIDEAMHKGVGAFYQETLDIMNSLRHMGIKICLLSNALPNLEDTAITLTDRNNIFLSYELGLLKPDINIFKTVLQKLNTLPQEVIFIDDKQKNIDAAKSIGIHSVIFNKDTVKDDINKILNISSSLK